MKLRSPIVFSLVLCSLALIAFFGLRLFEDGQIGKSQANNAAPPAGQNQNPAGGGTPSAPAIAPPLAPTAFTPPPPIRLPRANYLPSDPSWPVSPQIRLLLEAEEIAVSEPVLQADGSAVRERIVRTQDFKYSDLRVLETYRPLPGGDGFSARPDVEMAVADHVLVEPVRKLTREESQSLARSIGGSVRQVMPISGNLLLAFDGSKTGALAAAHEALSRESLVKIAEPDPIVYAFATTPNDPEFAKLYGLHNTGQIVNFTGGTADADIDAPEAWDITIGSRDVVIAVLDTGIDYSHPDLKDNIALNLGEIPGNGIDDDANGFIDDVYGWDFAEGDNNPYDGHSHGTHCAGTIGASGNNGLGIVGVNWQVRLLPIKFLDDNGSGTGSDAIEAIHYSRIRGVRITSNSWGGSGTSDAMKSAIDLAGAAGQIFVAAAGNNGNSAPQYPAAYTSTHIISVAASDNRDGIASFSCFDDGSGWVDVAAPGVDIYSTMPGGGYAFKDGTSMATPHVAGLMGLILSVRPDLSAADAIDWVKNTVDPKSAFAGKVTTGGRINARRALFNNLNTPYLNLIATAYTDNGDANGIPNPGETLTLAATLRNVSSAISTNATATLTLAAPDPYLTITSGSANLGTLASLAQATANFTFTVAPGTPTPRAVTLHLTTNDANGHSRVIPIQVTIYTMSSVSGTVREIDGTPVSGASVSYAGPFRGSVSTAANGTYSLSLVDGSHGLTVSKPGYTSAPERLVQLPPSRTGIDFVLARPRVTTPVTTLVAAAATDSRVTLEIPLANNGTAPATYTVREMEYGHATNGAPGMPAFQWIDISTTGTALEVTDLAFNQYEYFNAGPLPLGMDFPFFENSFRSFRVNNTGWISFTNASRSVFDFRVELPNRERPENMIAFAWTGSVDWTHWRSDSPGNPNLIAGARRLFYKQVDPQTFVITAHRWATGEYDLLTSQIILKRDGTIFLQYGAYTNAQGGSSNTFHPGPLYYIAGLQDAGGRRGITPILGPSRIIPAQGTVVRMRPVIGAPWLRTDSQNGILQPGSPAQPLRVTLDSTGLAAGTYTTKLVLDTTDAAQPTLEIPVTFTVSAGEASLEWVSPAAPHAALTPGSTAALEVRILGSTASVTGVNFYNGSTLLGAGTFVGPDRYTFNWANVPAGAHDLVAVATLSNGGSVSTRVQPAAAGTGFRVAIDAVDSSATTPAIGYHRALVERFGTPFINFETAANTVYSRPITITRSGSTATVDLPASYLMRFGFIGGLPITETVTITGAAQPEYNGTHTLTYHSFVSPNYRFTFPVSGTPATPSSGAQLSDFSRSVVSDGGRTIRVAGQASRKIALPATYTITANTVLEFDFLGTTDTGLGVFGVGLDNDNSLSASRVFQVWGKKTNWGSNRTYHNYVEDNSDSDTPRWRHYRIPVGQHITPGTTANFVLLIQANEDWYYRHDADATYRNITLYEDPLAASDYTHQWTVTEAATQRTGEEMIQAWLQPGEKTVSLVTSLGEQSATASRTVQLSGSGVFGATINFQPATAFLPIGYVPDSGAVFADRLNGYSYGWLGSANTSAVDAEYPVMSQFQELDTYIRQTTSQTWEIAVPNGTYRVYAAAGFAFFGATSATSNNLLQVEGQTLIDRNLPKDAFTDGLANVTVNDGRLTLTSHRNTAYVNLIDLVRTDAANIAPVAVFTASTLGGIAPVAITFDASASFVNQGSLVSYAWDFGDGNTATGMNVTHTFASPGQRIVRLTVTDSVGQTATSSTALTITGEPQVPTSLVLSPSITELATGSTRQFSATVRDQFDQPLFPQPAITWQVSGGGTINASGLFTTGMTPGGPHTVTATSGALSGNLSFTVVQAIATTVSITPEGAEVPTGDTQAFAATVRDQFGQPINPQPAVSWQVSGGGSISASGLFTAGTTPGGPHTVTATSGAASGTATVTVAAPAFVATAIVVTPSNPSVVTGSTRQFSAVVNDQNGNPLSTQPTIAWSVSGGGAISSGGLFTAGTTAGGPFTVTASASGLSGTASVTVTSTAVLFSTTFNAATSTSLDTVTVDGTGRNIAWTGAGSNLPAAAGLWTVPDPAKVDLYGLPNGQITFGATTYGTSTANTGLQKGSIFMVGNSAGFAFADTLAALNMSGDYVARTNNSTLSDTSFGVLFEIKAPAGTFTNWQLSYNYGTNGGSWVNNTAAAQGSTTARLYKVGAGNILDPTPVATFSSVNLAGAGPLAQLTATNSAVGEGVYLLKIDMAGKTNTQRYSIDNLILAASAPAPVLTPLEEWQSSAFPEQATLSQRTPDFDYDGDGLVNLLEYALGSDPATPTTAPAPQTLTDEGNQYLQIQWTRPNNRTDITTLGEVSDTLSLWSSAAGDVSTSVAPAGPGMETVTIRALSPLGPQTKRFLRVRVTQP